MVRCCTQFLRPPSQFNLIKTLAAAGANKSPAYSKDDLIERGGELARFAVKRWPLLESDLVEA